MVREYQLPGNAGTDTTPQHYGPPDPTRGPPPPPYYSYGAPGPHPFDRSKHPGPPESSNMPPPSMTGNNSSAPYAAAQTSSSSSSPPRMGPPPTGPPPPPPPPPPGGYDPSLYGAPRQSLPPPAGSPRQQHHHHPQQQGSSPSRPVLMPPYPPPNPRGCLPPPPGDHTSSGPPNIFPHFSALNQERRWGDGPAFGPPHPSGGNLGNYKGPPPPSGPPQPYSVPSDPGSLYYPDRIRHLQPPPPPPPPPPPTGIPQHIVDAIIVPPRHARGVGPEGYNDVDGRDGATSPTQIASSHRDEVTNTGCTCKRSRCLKLYCQCFAVKIYCGSNCRCHTCRNLMRFEKERKDAVRNILARNPAAFEIKFKKTNERIPTHTGPSQERILAHKLGCKCLKSACMKKYCECYAGNVKCNINCRCRGCKNMPVGGFGPRPIAPAVDTKSILAPRGEPLPSVVTSNSFHAPEIPHHHRAAATANFRRLDTGVSNHNNMNSNHGIEPSWMMDAAQNLTFLKNASPSQQRLAQIDSRDSASMPSLTSVSDTMSPGEKRSEELSIPSLTPKEPSPEKEEEPVSVGADNANGVNVLLMAAAYAMTELSTDSQKGTSDSDTSPPSKGTDINNRRPVQLRTAPDQKKPNSFKRKPLPKAQSNSQKELRRSKRSRHGLWRKNPSSKDEEENSTSDESSSMPV